MQRSKTSEDVPNRRVKEEVRRWNSHLEHHKRRVGGARSTITSTKSKGDERLDHLQRGSQYKSDQRNLSIQHDNQLLLKKLQKISTRDENMSRNSYYYEKRKPKSNSQNNSPLTLPTSALMKSVRDKKKKSIEEEKNRIEGKISAEHKKQRVGKPPGKGGKDATPRPTPLAVKTNDVESIRPNVSRVKLEKDRTKNNGNISARLREQERNKKRLESKKKVDPKTKKPSGETKTQKKSTKEEKVAKKEETETSKGGYDEDIDREIDRIIVHSTYSDDENDNFQIDVVEGSQKEEKEKDDDDVDDVINAFLKMNNDDTEEEEDNSTSIPLIVIPTGDPIEDDVVEDDVVEDDVDEDDVDDVDLKDDGSKEKVLTPTRQQPSASSLLKKGKRRRKSEGRKGTGDDSSDTSQASSNSSSSSSSSDTDNDSDTL